MFTRLVIRWIILSLALYVTVYIGHQMGLHMKVTDPAMLILGAAVLGFVNSVIAPILKFLACAINCLTLGLAGVLINVLLFWGVGQLGLGYVINDFWSALFGSVVLGLIQGVLSFLIPEPDDKKE